MPAADFYETRMGRTFFERDVPKFVSAVERIATALERIATQCEEDADAGKLSRNDLKRILAMALAEQGTATVERERTPDNHELGGIESC